VFAIRMMARQEIIRKIRIKTINALASQNVWEIVRRNAMSEIEEFTLWKVTYA
jgi:hypothetical protein